MNCFPLDKEVGKKCVYSLVLSNILLEFLAHILKKRKLKSIEIRKEEIKLSLFSGEIFVYVENPKKRRKRTCQSNKYEFRKVVGYKINIQKSIVFLYTNNWYVDTEIKIKCRL